ncbi:MAG: hypothetical protein ACKOB0_02070 [Chthoniobacterales bacterium]
MERNQAIWLILVAIALYFGSMYCGQLLAAIAPRLAEWFGGRPLPTLSQWALDASRFVAVHGKWVAVVLLVLAAVSFWRNSKPNAADGRQVAVLNAIGYYAARSVLVFSVLLAILQAHGMLFALFDLDRQNHGYRATGSQALRGTFHGKVQSAAPGGWITKTHQFRVRSQLIDTPPPPKDRLYKLAPL